MFLFMSSHVHGISSALTIWSLSNIRCVGIKQLLAALAARVPANSQTVSLSRPVDFVSRPSQIGACGQSRARYAAACISNPPRRGTEAANLRLLGSKRYRNRVPARAHP